MYAIFLYFIITITFIQLIFQWGGNPDNSYLKNNESDHIFKICSKYRLVIWNPAKIAWMYPVDAMHLLFQITQASVIHSVPSFSNFDTIEKRVDVNLILS